MRFAFYTLGCKTNQYETQAMEQLLTELGHEIGQFDQPCDGYIINTCSVTAVADQEKPGGHPPMPPGIIPTPSSAYAAATPSTPRRRCVRWGWTSSAAAAGGGNSWS